MATFTANGLLGSNTTHVPINPKDAAPTAFLPDSLQEIQTIFSMDDLDTNDNESSESHTACVLMSPHQYSRYIPVVISSEWASREQCYQYM